MLRKIAREIARPFYSLFRAIFSKINFLRNYRTFKSLNSKLQQRFILSWRDRYPCLYDKTADTSFDRHYIYHPAWAARVIEKTRPMFHVDISSTLAFCSIVSAFVPVKFYDFRPAKLDLNNLNCDSADLLSLPFENESIHSISCMHVVEHVGLGRYGDTIDPDGDIKAISELKRVLAVGGSLLFVVPIGNKAKICYNAHRIYTHEQIASYFQELELVEFCLIPENEPNGGLIQNPSEELLSKEKYGCGCFWFRNTKNS